MRGAGEGARTLPLPMPTATTLKIQIMRISSKIFRGKFVIFWKKFWSPNFPLFVNFSFNYKMPLRAEPYSATINYVPMRRLTSERLASQLRREL